ncbi:MAG: hypothetical protein ABSF43_04610 [Rectinemataceae bacterium]|jgi:hypothetical protein
MQRKPLFLVAAVTESARFFILFFLANALGGLRQDAGLSSFFRYASGAQLFFVIGFFFLWLDLPRYDAYRSLLFVGRIISLATFIPLFIAMIHATGSGNRIDSSSFIFASVVLGLDMFGFCVLLISKPFSAFTGQSPVTGLRPQSPASQGPSGQGPDEIERVESL